MNATLCRRLKELRNRKNMGQDQVSKLVGVGKASISQYENGSREPSLETLMKLASVYHVTTDYLLGCEQTNMIDVGGVSDRLKWLLSEIIVEVSKKGETDNKL